MFRKLVVLLATLLALPAFSQQAHFDGKSWWENIKFLADDKLEGRDTGSEGLRKAQVYVVDKLKDIGLQPAGTNGYYQPVKFVSRQIVEADSHVSFISNGKSDPLVFGEEGFLGSRVDLPTEPINAPLVFAGYGLKIPEQNYDDLAGLDLKGKVAVYIGGSPADVPSALSAHYQSAAERWKSLKAAGVLGVVYILNPSSQDIPWSRIAANRNRPTMQLEDPEFDETPGEKLSVIINPAKADRLFAGPGHTFQELADLAKDRKPMPHFPLSVSIQAKVTIETKPVESANLAAILPGSDPALKNEYVVLTAHIDHVGIGAPINGDSIYNGAMDNASGTSVLLDVAASFKKSQEKLRRSILFVWVTGEEKGLLGSKYFAAHPTVDAKSMVANVNTDMFLPIIPLKILTVYGLAESDLGDRIKEVAGPMGIRVQPDPEPLRNAFIRSDQYNFVHHGIPALAMGVGFDPGTPEQQIFKDWRTNRYHAPSDDLNQPVDLAAAAAYEEVYRALVVAVANADQRPQWKPDSFFRRYAQ